MRKVFFVGLCLLASACGASATTRTATPITESSVEAREEPSPEELELYALQEEACSQPGAGNGPVVMDGVSFYCFAD